jgi:hypothetical protein
MFTRLQLQLLLLLAQPQPPLPPHQHACCATLHQAFQESICQLLECISDVQDVSPLRKVLL